MVVGADAQDESSSDEEDADFDPHLQQGGSPGLHELNNASSTRPLGT